MSSILVQLIKFYRVAPVGVQSSEDGIAVLIREGQSDRKLQEEFNKELP